MLLDPAILPFSAAAVFAGSALAIGLESALVLLLYGGSIVLLMV